MREILLTFDVEDFISNNSIQCLELLLEHLKKYRVKALFFITGHMAEKLAGYPNIVDLLKEHEIGYHSSSHSVHPALFEFTDIESYEDAYYISLTRESSHINPLTGEIEGKGGIFALQHLFPAKSIASYRAPGFCWSPPHTESLRDLGIKFDFSSHISSAPVYYKGLTFYPYPSLIKWQGRISDYCFFLRSIQKKDVMVVDLHPSLFVNQEDWDSIYWKGNPEHISCPRPRESREFRSLFRSFDLFLKNIRQMEKMKLVDARPNLRTVTRELSVTKNCVEQIYQYSIRWPKQFFNYKPMHLRKHFYKFFELL